MSTSYIGNVPLTYTPSDPEQLAIGVSPPSGSGLAVTNYNGQNLNVAFGDGYNIDAFGRLRVSHTETLFDCKQIDSEDGIYWTTGSVVNGNGGVAYVMTASATMLTATSYGMNGGSPGGSPTDIFRQTRMRFNYQPGKSQLCFITFNLLGAEYIGGTAAPGINRIGYYDGQNGIYLESNIPSLTAPASFSFNIKNNGVLVGTAAQSYWNLDKMDGSGPSGRTISFGRPQILVIDFEWLGVGRVRCGFVIDGAIYYCHQFVHANHPQNIITNGQYGTERFTSVYMRNCNLPIRAEAVGINFPDQTSTTAYPVKLEMICSSVMSEGGTDDTGKLVNIRTTSAGITINNGNRKPLIGFRPISSSAVLKLDEAGVMTPTANGNFYCYTAFNPVIANADTITWQTVPGTLVQWATASSAAATHLLSSDGYVIDGEFVSAQGRNTSHTHDTFMHPGWFGNGRPEEVWLCAESLGTNTSYFAFLTIKEI